MGQRHACTASIRPETRPATDPSVFRPRCAEPPTARRNPLEDHEPCCNVLQADRVRGTGIKKPAKSLTGRAEMMVARDRYRASPTTPGLSFTYRSKVA